MNDRDEFEADQVHADRENDRYSSASLTFVISQEAWYAAPDTRVEIYVSLDAPGGGTVGEFSFRWVDLGRTPPAPRLEIFDDAWRALVEIESRTDGRFLEGLAARDGRNLPVAEIARWLKSLGFADTTSRVAPADVSPYAQEGRNGAELAHLRAENARLRAMLGRRSFLIDTITEADIDFVEGREES